MVIKHVVNKINIITNKSGFFYIYVYAPAGAIYETKHNSGGSHMLEHMLFKNRSQWGNISKSLTSIGGKYNAATYKDVTYYFIETHSTHYQTAIELIRDITTQGNFSTQDLINERKVVIEEHAQTTDNFYSTFFNLASKSLLHEDNVYLASVIGSLKVLKTISAHDLKQYYRAHYKNLVIVVNCDEKIKAAVGKSLVEHFGPQEAFDFSDNTLHCKASMIEPKLIFANTSFKQYITRLSFKGFEGGNVKDNIMLRFVRYCLTGSGLYSVLNHELREVRGLVYSVSSYVESFRFLGLYYIQLGSSSKKTDYIISIILETLSKLKTAGLPKKMFDYYKKSYISSMRLNMSDEQYRSNVHGLNMFYGSYIDDKHILQMLKKITNQDIIDICKKVFDFSQLGVISMGKYANVDHINNTTNDIIQTYISR